MNRKQLFAVIAMTYLSFLIFGHYDNFTFGLMDNAPMLVLMLWGCDPEGPLCGFFAKYNVPAVFVQTGVAMATNGGTDWTAGVFDPTVSAWGVLFGCLICIPFLVVAFWLRDKSKDPQLQDLMREQDELLAALEINCTRMCNYKPKVRWRDSFWHRQGL
jgi:hypothetical protein